MYSTRLSRRVRAPKAEVYRALVDPDAIARWRVPEGMTSEVHAFEARDGGTFRVSLTYDEPGSVGKSSSRTDTYGGHFAELVPGERVVEVLAFESDDPALGGTMTMTTMLAEAADGGTDVTILHEGIPDSVPRCQNELGTRMALDKLAALVEHGSSRCNAASPRCDGAE